MNPAQITVLVLRSVDSLITIPLIGLIIWRRKKQPVKSRGILPIVACLFSLVSSVVEIILNFNLIPFGLQCYIYDTITRPLAVLLLFTVLLQELRFILFRGMNRYKTKIFVERGNSEEKITEGKNSSLKVKVPIGFRILWILSSNWSLLALQLLVYGSYLLIKLIVAASHEFNCYRLFFLPPYQYFSYLSTFIALSLVMAILDFASNWKIYLRCDLKRLFYWDDPFFFRVEFYVFSAIMIWMLICQAVIYPYIPFEVFWLISVIQTANEVIILLMCTLFPVILSFFIQKGKNKNTENELIQVLNDPKGHDMLSKFAEAEWSIENIMLYDAIQDFKKLTSVKRMKHVAQAIFQAHLSKNAVLEVNISRQKKKSISEAIESGNMNNDIFREVEVVTLENLQDTFERFKKLPQYKLLKHQIEMSDQLMKKSGMV